MSQPSSVDELSSPSDFISRMRHTTAHVLAQAIRERMPDAQMAIGPVIDNGFFYDFQLPEQLSEDDFPAIEARMRQIVKANLPLVRWSEPRDVARKRCEELSQTFKVRLIDDLPDEAEISFYQQGDFVDLCRGPHVPSTGKLKVFKLMKVAGA